MGRITAAILLGFVLLTAAIIWLGRYQTTTAEAGHFYVTDRWTGLVFRCAAPGWRPPEPNKSDNFEGGCVRAFFPENSN